MEELLAGIGEQEWAVTSGFCSFLTRFRLYTGEMRNLSLFEETSLKEIGRPALVLLLC